MTKKRDRYQSRFANWPQPGVRAGRFDLNFALDLLDGLVKEQKIEQARYDIGDGDSWTAAELVAIAYDALACLWDITEVYQRLQQNEEAARLLHEATGEPGWELKHDALTLSLSNKAIISRGWVSAARRELARREKEQNGGDAS